MNDFLIKIGGEAGLGIMTTGLALGKYFARQGYEVFGYVEYPSLIRGGHNTYEVRVSTEKIHSSKWKVDFLICLNRETFEKHKGRLAKGAVVFYDPEEFEVKENFAKVEVPVKNFLKEGGDSILFSNSIYLGAVIGYLGGDLEDVKKLLVDFFEKKGKEVVEKNFEYAKRGFKVGSSKFEILNSKQILNPKSEILNKSGGKLVMTGNEGFSLSAVAADCRFYAAYPMTPSSSVLSTLAAWQKDTGMIVRHAEDEIGVINEALGASFAGVRSAVGTSGGGFALMVETLSYAGVAEIPIVVLLAQRPGPATGMPTWTEQGDLLFAINAGHGEFMKIVLAPGDIEEMLELVPEAFNLADIYQTPVIVISDKFLSESFISVEKTKVEKILDSIEIDRGKLITADQVKDKYLRYKVTEDGISPRLLPGEPGYFYQANSYEHLEDSHTTEEAAPRVEQVNKRNRKIETYLQNHFRLPKVYGDLKKAKYVVVGWGSTKGPALDALEKLDNFAYVHFTHIWPLDREKVKKLLEPAKDKLVLLENNSFGQFGSIIEGLGFSFVKKILKYDGRPFYAEEIVESLKSLL